MELRTPTTGAKEAANPPIPKVQDTVRPPGPPRVGQRLGKFLLTARLGQGNEGLVFRALHVGLNLDRAVKVLTSHGACPHKVLERLQNEARLLSRIEHPNIVRVFDLEEDGERPFFVMEFVEGLNLAELIGQSGRVAVDRTLNLIIQVAGGLRMAAGFGVVHRDVKPANILLTKDGTAKLSDLGSGILIGPEGDDHKGRPRQIVGTPYYMAPEQLEGTSSVDPRADIYALGSTFYHAITGKYPFEAGSVRELLYRKSTSFGQPGSLIPPDQVCPDVSADVSAVVLRMMAPNPDDRYQDYDELLAALEGLRAGAAPATSPTGLSSTTTNDPRRTQQLNHLLTATSAPRLPGLAESIRMAMEALSRGDKKGAKQAVLPHRETSAGSEAVWLALIKASETLDEAIGYAEAGVKAAPASERLRAMMATLAKQKPAPKKCFFCSTPDTGMLACLSCGGLTTLPAPDGYPAAPPARTDVIQRAITAYDKAMRERPAARWEYALGLGWLTLRQDREALKHFRAAAQGGFEIPADHIDGLENHVAAAEHEARRIRIAVVDDSPTIRKLVQSKLAEFDYAVLSLSDGAEAIEKLPGFEPHLILMDINMPGQDGYQMCRWVKAHRTLRDVPVVMLSGDDGFFDKVRGRMAGASRHIGKPFNTDELLQVIDSLCAKSRRRLNS